MQSVPVNPDMKGWLYAALAAALGVLTYTVYKSEQSNTNTRSRRVNSNGGGAGGSGSGSGSARSSPPGSPRRADFRLRQLGAGNGGAPINATFNQTNVTYQIHSGGASGAGGAGVNLYAPYDSYDGSVDPETYSAKRKDRLVNAATEHAQLLAPIKHKHQRETAQELAAVSVGAGASSKTSVGADSNIFYDMLQVYSGVQRVANETDGSGSDSDSEGGMPPPDGTAMVAHPFYQYYSQSNGRQRSDSAANGGSPYASPASAYGAPPPSNTTRSPYNYAESEHWSQQRRRQQSASHSRHHKSPPSMRSRHRKTDKSNSLSAAAASAPAAASQQNVKSNSPINVTDASVGAGTSEVKSTSPTAASAAAAVASAPVPNPSPQRSTSKLPHASPNASYRRYKEAAYSPPSPPASQPERLSYTSRTSSGSYRSGSGLAPIGSTQSPKSSLNQPLPASITSRVPLTATPSARMAVPVAAPTAFSFHSFVDQSASAPSKKSSVYARRSTGGGGLSTNSDSQPIFGQNEEDEDDPNDIERILHGDRLIRDRHRPSSDRSHLDPYYNANRRDMDSLEPPSVTRHHHRLPSHEQQKDMLKPKPSKATGGGGGGGGAPSATGTGGSDSKLNKRGSAPSLSTLNSSSANVAGSGVSLSPSFDSDYVPVGDVDSRSGSPELPAPATNRSSIASGPAAAANSQAAASARVPFAFTAESNDSDSVSSLPASIAALAAASSDDHTASVVGSATNARPRAAPENPDLAAHLSGRNDLFSQRQEPRLTK